jgi:DNA-binding CsgD family transcriptional regulator
MEQIVARNEECGGEIFELHDVLACQQDCVSVAVARKLDWQDVCAQLEPREKAIISLMVEGAPGPVIARKLGVCPSTISNSKRKLAVKIKDVLGVNIISEVLRRPSWQDSINASRERSCCRDERRHL